MTSQMRYFGFVSMAVAGALFGLSGCATKDDPKGEQSPSADSAATVAQRITTRFPKSRVQTTNQGQVRRISGQALAVGDTPLAASELFRQQYAAAMGATTEELRPVELQQGARQVTATAKPVGLMYDKATGQYKYLLYRYAQARGGIPVHGGELLTVVKNSGDHAVVLASSTVRDLGAFAATTTTKAPSVDPKRSVEALAGGRDSHGNVIPPPQTLARFSEPEWVIYAGTDKATEAPRMAIQYTGENDSPKAKYRFIADAKTGRILQTESLVLFTDIQGTVSGNVTQGSRAAECAEEVSTPFPFADVSIADGTTTETGNTGAFTLATPGSTAVNVTSTMTGKYFDVVNCGGNSSCPVATAEDDITFSVTPPGPATFVHNELNTAEYVRAQSNGYINAHQVRNFVLECDPAYPTISTQTNFPVYVNRVNGYCPGNAWYDYSSINFCAASTSYGNTSFGSISHHEYGHHVVSTGGSGQDEYGEGMADAIAVLIAKESGTGYGFYLNNCSNPLRNADNDCQYSATQCSTGGSLCGSEIHDCGNLLSGIIWDIREQLMVTEPDSYDTIIAQLAVDSVKVHTGGSIDPSIAVDLLTLDDNDGNIGNGTPHRTEICAGFDQHGIDCPILDVGLDVTPNTGLLSEGQVGGPFTPESTTFVLENLGPDANLSYQVAVPGGEPWVSVENAAGTIALGDSVNVVVSIDQEAAATLAQGKYEAAVSFTNTTSGVGDTTRTVSLRAGIPVVIYGEDFEEGNGEYTLSSLWHTTSSCRATSEGHTTPQALYFGVDETCTYATNQRVTGYAVSPSIDIDNTAEVSLNFKYFLENERSTYWDRATAEVSINGGSYQIVASSTDGSLNYMGTGWLSSKTDITSLFEGLSNATMTVRFGFDSIDGDSNGYAGFLVDDVEVRAFEAPPKDCDTDFDCDDMVLCNGTELCVEGFCQAGSPVVCNDDIPCTVDSCSEASGECTFTPDDTACDDGDACTGTETCNAATGCVAGEPLDCNDNDACTTDSCNADSGCSNDAITCDDGDACTADICDAELGCQTSPLSCDDGNGCTTDTCDTVSGCLNTNNTDPCADDNDTCTDDVCSAGVCTHPSNGTCTSEPFREVDGMVIMEAEHYDTAIARANHQWSLATNTSASNGEMMFASPNDGTYINAGYVTGSPQLDYGVNFSTTGTYYVWVRGSGPTASDDSCHAGIDGTGPATSDRIGIFSAKLGWRKNTLDGTPATISISAAGVHVINLWMREDGFRADKLLLTTDPNYTPTGMGPEESPRGNGCTNDSHCNDGNTCTTDSCVEGLCQNTPASDGTACADDANVCTDDVCGAGVCTHPANSGACPDDGSICTDDICSEGTCTHPDNGTCQCAGDTDCNDDNACTLDSCVSGACQNTAVADGTICPDDGDECTSDICGAGVCTHPDSGTCECDIDTDCDDGNVCTLDSCESHTCQTTPAPNGTTCPDDGNTCTNDVCGAGVCTHPDNGSCAPKTPCTGICSNPTTFTVSGNYQSGGLGTGTVCRETTSNIYGGNCGNFGTGRTLSVNGITMPCTYQNWPSLPPKVNGGYCVTATAGNYAWATFTMW